MTGQFAPFSGGSATTSPDGKSVTGTLAVRAGLRIRSAEVIDGTLLVCVFERVHHPRHTEEK